MGYIIFVNICLDGDGELPDQLFRFQLSPLVFRDNCLDLGTCLAHL